jgi:hypothetical protein
MVARFVHVVPWVEVTVVSAAAASATAHAVSRVELVGVSVSQVVSRVPVTVPVVAHVVGWVSVTVVRVAHVLERTALTVVRAVHVLARVAARVLRVCQVVARVGVTRVVVVQVVPRVAVTVVRVSATPQDVSRVETTGCGGNVPVWVVSPSSRNGRGVTGMSGAATAHDVARVEVTVVVVTRGLRSSSNDTTTPYEVGLVSPSRTQGR